MRLWFSLVCFFLWVAATGSANSSIRVEAIPISNGPVVIFVQGTFEANDTPTELIRSVVINNAKLVSFDSNGGSIAAAMALAALYASWV